MTDTHDHTEIASVAMRVIRDRDALGDHMRALNDAGAQQCEVAGVDANGTPFLAGLSGPYADTEWAQVGNPWDVEIGWDGDSCSDCGAQRGSQVGIDRLVYPVTIFVGGEQS